MKLYLLALAILSASAVKITEQVEKPRPSAATIIRQADLDNDKKMDLQELINQFKGKWEGIGRKWNSGLENKLREQFKQDDVNGDGEIDVDELEAKWGKNKKPPIKHLNGPTTLCGLQH